MSFSISMVLIKSDHCNHLAKLLSFSLQALFMFLLLLLVILFVKSIFS